MTFVSSPLFKITLYSDCGEGDIGISSFHGVRTLQLGVVDRSILSRTIV